jgi:hypothetical protein
MGKLTPQTAYRAGCSNGIRAGSIGRMFWRDGQPEVSGAEVRADALDSFAIMTTPDWTDFKDGLPAISAREDIEQLVSEYARGFAEARQAAIEAETAGREVDQSYYQPPVNR